MREEAAPSLGSELLCEGACYTALAVKHTMIRHFV